MDQSFSGTQGLAALEARVARDLRCLNDPTPNWVPPRGAVSDVVIVGAGMCGLVAAFALRRAGVANLRILDRRPAGLEGPWLTYARMETLRSPKQLTGPAYGMASLTFQAYYLARFGEAAWAELTRIPRRLWMEYLVWYRRVLALPVENGVEVAGIAPTDDGLLALTLTGATSPALARRVVLATGREGLGEPTIPAFVRGLPRARWAHSSETIDFAALRGRRVVVIGVGASAMDNAAEALEAGAAEVRLLARRARMPTINKLMGIGSYGFTAGFPTLSPAWRWRFMQYAARCQTPAPRNSTQRVGRHRNAYFHFGCAIEAMDVEAGAVVVRTRGGRRFETDMVILGTGFSVRAGARPELGAAARHVAVWADRFQPPPDEANAELGEFPWLDDAFAFTERAEGAAPWLSRVHCFNYAASLSLGKVSGDIPAISDGARMLAQAIAARLFAEDVERHWAQAQDYAKPELLGDEWHDADETAYMPTDPMFRELVEGGGDGHA